MSTAASISHERGKKKFKHPTRIRNLDLISRRMLYQLTNVEEICR